MFFSFLVLEFGPISSFTGIRIRAEAFVDKAQALRAMSLEVPQIWGKTLSDEGNGLSIIIEIFEFDGPPECSFNLVQRREDFLFQTRIRSPYQGRGFSICSGPRGMSRLTAEPSDRPGAFAIL